MTGWEKRWPMGRDLPRHFGVAVHLDFDTGYPPADMHAGLADLAWLNANITETHVLTELALRVRHSVTFTRIMANPHPLHAKPRR
jgi:hypothetical protein